MISPSIFEEQRHTLNNKFKGGSHAHCTAWTQLSLSLLLKKKKKKRSLSLSIKYTLCYLAFVIFQNYCIGYDRKPTNHLSQTPQKWEPCALDAS